jgi:rsbT co-antagonist protein RsbR
MTDLPSLRLQRILSVRSQDLLAEWTAIARTRADHRISASEIEMQCASVIARLADAYQTGDAVGTSGEALSSLREHLADIARARALLGFAPSEVAFFIFSLKAPLLERIREEVANDLDAYAREAAGATALVDALGMHMVDMLQRSREEVIVQQHMEMSELSTPVVKLWDGILALPLIGTLDSSRTQVVMETLLEAIVRHEADIAIIDITGVPTVDTLVAQHLLKTVAAARLMGADCIISGIRPQIAQTMVHLGVDLNVVSKSNLADAFALALRKVGRTVVGIRTQARDGAAHAG